MKSSPAFIAKSPKATMACNLAFLSWFESLSILISGGTKSVKYLLILCFKAEARSDTSPQAILVHSSSFPVKAKTTY